MAAYAGVDVGATNLRAVVGDADGRLLGRAGRATPRGPTGIDVTEAVLGTLRDACDAAGVAPTALRAVGIGSIGPLDLTEGAVVRPANLPGAVDRIPLSGPIEQLVDGAPVYLQNDTTAGVVGERFYADRNPDDMVYLTLSSGVGAGICVDGTVLEGWDGNAGEVGHFRVDPAGRMTCGCGLDGHWEAYCGGANIPEYLRWLAERDPALETAVSLADETLTAADVMAVGPDDPLVAHLLERLAHWNAIGVANVVHAYAPLEIAIGGAVALENAETIVEPIRERVPELVMTNVPRIRLTSLGDEVVVRGALAGALTGGTGDRSRLTR